MLVTVPLKVSSGPCIHAHLDRLAELDLPDILFVDPGQDLDRVHVHDSHDRGNLHHLGGVHNLAGVYVLLGHDPVYRGDDPVSETWLSAESHETLDLLDLPLRGGVPGLDVVHDLLRDGVLLVQPLKPLLGGLHVGKVRLAMSSPPFACLACSAALSFSMVATSCAPSLRDPSLTSIVITGARLHWRERDHGLGGNVAGGDHRSLISPVFTLSVATGIA